MPSEHPGFAPWGTGDAANPFPVGQIDLLFGSETGAMAYAKFTIPQTQPTPSTYAERSIGIAHSAQLWFALECSTDAQGKLTYEAVLRGRHLYWFDDHGETEAGPMQEIRLSPTDLAGNGSREKIADHGHHCDTFNVTWFQVGGQPRCDLTVLHHNMSERELLDLRAHPKRHSTIILEPFDQSDDPRPPPPRPKPDKNAN